jgi:hypothetical protein
MSIIPGRYGGYGVRLPRPGSASRMVEPIPEGWKNTYARAEKALAEPFRGVTTDGKVVPGLFSPQQTGVSTELVKDAADCGAEKSRPPAAVDHTILGFQGSLRRRFPPLSKSPNTAF